MGAKAQTTPNLPGACADVDMGAGTRWHVVAVLFFCLFVCFFFVFFFARGHNRPAYPLNYHGAISVVEPF